MAYDLLQLLTRVQARLQASPAASLAELSRALGVSRHTIERAVRSASGKTFRHWRRKLLFGKAADLLKAGGALSIKEVAFMMGYKSPQAFARFVKRSCGCSPTKLRRASALPKPR